MKQNIASFKIHGMQRDINWSDISQVDKEHQVHTFAYENMNMRINAVDDNTQYALTNEKGTLNVDTINGLNNGILGIPLGQNVLNNTLTLFTTDTDYDVLDIESSEYTQNIESVRKTVSIKVFNKKDRIYKLWFENNIMQGKLLYEGDLNFDTNYPIDTISFFENEDLQKVYWIDGINQPRVLNISASNNTLLRWNDYTFDFVRRLTLKENISITKNFISNGYFNPGTIQYCFTYFDKYHQETNIFYTSPLYYISYIDRGTPVNETVNNSFDIKIDNVNTEFDYLRIYSIVRTAENTMPQCSIVADISIDETNISITDLSYTHTTLSPVSKIRFKLVNSTEVYTIQTLPPEVIVNVTQEETTVIFNNVDSETSLLDTIYIDDNEIKLDIGNMCIVKINTHNIVNVDAYFYVQGESPKRTDPNNPHRTANLKLYTVGNTVISYTDTGLHKQTIDPTELLYVGGEEITVNTFEHKDNTLFLGDIQLKKPIVGNIITSSSNESIKQKLYNHSEAINFVADKELPLWDITGVYSVDNQLKYNSSEIKTFKYGEWYRFGIQFQYINGKWSEPLWIGDKKNSVHIDTPYVKNTATKLVTAHLNISDILNDRDISILRRNNFIKVRPVIVYPSLQEREVLCQGYLCPTVFNYADRYNKHCYAQASWFARPNITLPRSANGDYIQKANTIPYTNSNWEEQHQFKKGYSGRPLEYRHNFPIPDNMSFSSEIQSIGRVKNPRCTDELNNNASITKYNMIEQYGNYYAVDSNIVTMHSPDIDDLYNIDLSNCKMRIVGMIPLTASVGNISIMTETAGIAAFDGHWNKEDLLDGLDENFKASDVFNPNYALENTTINGANILGAGVYYKGQFYADNANGSTPQIDNIGVYPIEGIVNSNFNSKLTDIQKNGEGGVSTPFGNLFLSYELTTNNGFVIYPWHRTGSLINQCSGDFILAKLGEKKLSNLRYSYNSFYFDSIWNPTNGINDCQIYNSDEPTPIKLKTIINTKEQSVLYRGNIDSVNITNINSDYRITAVRGVTTNSSTDRIVKNLFTSDFEDMGEIFSGHSNTENYNSYVLNHRYSTSPISIKYKSTPHIVLSLKNEIIGTNTRQNILPYLTFPFDPTSTSGINTNEDCYGYSSEANYTYQFKYFWDDSINRINQDEIVPLDIEGIGGNMGRHLYGFLWLGEIYRDNVVNRFGGISEEAFELNKWLPCGKAFDLRANTDIVWSEGDTYYQRYDNLKTYAYTNNDENSIVDIISFMCETRHNIDGRTDRNRGLTDNTVISPINFNLFNKAYTQTDNFFSYNYINSNRINLDNFHNIVTWTKTKTAGDLVDTWTNITMASTLDLDGDRGSVVSLKRLGNNIYALQNKAVCVIKFNENVAINTTNGTPIELANSGKVLGKEYLSTEIGCDNKWSVCRSDNKLFFIDGNHSDIYALAGNQFVNLTAQFGFSSFIDSELENSGNWNPVSFDNFITYYDKINHDVFFINKNKCLAFNEVLNSFTSFYSYNNTPYFANIDNRGVFINKSYNDTKYKPWLYEEGNYNQFFGEYKPYYTQIVVNDYPQTNKIFDVMEYRADAFDTQYDDLFTFDYIKTKNEYQNNDVDLTYNRHHSSNLKKKFRTWRATLPRDYSHRRDRMQNLWLNIEIGRRNFEELSKKHILYDMNVSYYI